MSARARALRAGAAEASRRAGVGLAGRPVHASVAAAAVGLALAPARAAAALAVAATCAIVAALLRAPAAGALAAAALLAGAVAGEARIEATERSRLADLTPLRLDTRAELLERPRRRANGGWRVAARLLDGPGAGERALLTGGRWVPLPAAAGTGAEVAVRGTAARPPPPRPGAGFDWAAHLRRRGILVELRAASVSATGTRRAGLAGALDAARRRAARAVAAGMTPERAALARGMVVGEDEDVAEAVREAFRRSGLAHVLAVSGQNVMLLCALALPLLAAAGIRGRARLAALVVLVALYVPLAGAGAPLQRAGVMGVAGLAALLAGRPGSRWYALALAAAVTLAISPRAAADPGWQLSFAAVGAILLLAPPLRRPLSALPRPLAEGLAVTVAATIGTAPLLAHHFGSVSLAGLPANVLAMPFVAAAMWLGMLQIAVGQLLDAGGSLGAAALVAAKALGRLNSLCVGAVSATAEAFAQAPGAAVALPLGSPAAVAAAYAAIAVAAAGVGLLARRLGPRAESAAATAGRIPLRRRAALAAGAGALVALGAGQALAPAAAPHRPTVSFLDVGQGDATVIQDGRGAAVLFDGGPPEGDVVRRLREAGVRRLTAVVATHASRDHHGGLPDVLEQIPTALLLDGGDGNPDPAFRAVLAAADRRGIRRVPARAGQSLRVGGLAIRVLSPPPRPAGPAPEDPNPRAVVAIVSAGSFDLFLSGDAESPSLAGLDLPDVEAMKVPHHGSKDPGLPQVLERLRPEVAVAEVGEGNGYGHPAPETMRALEQAGARALRTDRDGTVTVTTGPAGLEVATDP